MPLADLAQLCHLHLVDFYRQSIAWVSGGVISEHDGALLYAADSPYPGWANGAFRTDPTISPDAFINLAVGFFLPRGQSFGFFVQPGVDDDIAQFAEAQGMPLMMARYPVMVIERPVKAASREGTSLKWAETPADIEAVFAIVIDSYADAGMPDRALAVHFAHPERALQPHVRWVLALTDGQPAACAMAMLSHGIAGLYWVGTLESHRGRGLGETVTAAVTNASFDMGARAVTLQASEMGEPIYSRMGYENLFDYRVYGKRVTA